MELGEWRAGGQGTRTDINAALDVIRANPTTEGLRQLYDDHGEVMVKYTNGMANFLHHYAGRKTRDDPPSVYVYYGETGTGKTYTVFNRHGLQNVWRAPVSTSGIQWFDGFLGQDVALFDDFDGAHPAITVMLQVLDRYPVQVPVKKSHTWFMPSTIYITTNIKFEDWYPEASQAHRDALKRRITEFRRFIYMNMTGSEIVNE